MIDLIPNLDYYQIDLRVDIIIGKMVIVGIVNKIKKTNIYVTIVTIKQL
jgi:hypothetical protein